MTVYDYCQQQHLNVSGFYQWPKKLSAESATVITAYWLSLPVTDIPNDTSDWQIELVLPGGVTPRIK
ncbi:MAG: hypothetical protein ACI9YH_003891 [Colwellia sp.]